MISRLRGVLKAGIVQSLLDKGGFSMKKLAIIGANDFQNQLIMKAKSLGYETHVFAWQCGDVGERTADYFYPISIVEKDKILEKCKEIGIDGICSIASDLATITVNYIAEKMGLCGNSMRCTEISTNKYLMRIAFQKNGIPVPKFMVCDGKTGLSDMDMIYPCIVKPTDRSGSRAITKVTSPHMLSKAVNDAIEQSFEKKAVIEEFIEGNEYSCECITQNGMHHFLALTKKFTTGAPHFIETGHMQPSDIPDELTDSVISQVFKALDALEIKNSASHTEFKLDRSGFVRIIEIGARMGGDCIGSDLVRLSTGYDFIKMVIDTALGEPIDLTRHEHYKNAYIRFIFDKEDFEEMEKLKKASLDCFYRISDIDMDMLGKAKDSSTRAGYYIVKALESR